MKKFLLSFFCVFALFALSAQVSDNFSDYTVGGKLAQQAQAMGRNYWTTWSNAPGGPEDGVIAELSSNKVLHINTASVDQVLLFNGKTSGVWELTFRLYIPASSCGYFNVLADFAGAGSTWAVQVYLGVQGESPNNATPGVGTMHIGGSNTVGFTFTHDAWTDVKVIVDLDNDEGKIFINNTQLHTWQYTLGTFGAGCPRVLDAMNVFPPVAWSNFYVDDIVLSSASSEILYETCFDDVPNNSYVAQSYPDWWTTWENNPGTGEDALITNEQSASTPQSAKCTYSTGTGTDLVFKAGNKTTGAYTIDFDMYIPSGSPAYFNVLHNFAGTGSEWAVGIYFSVTASGMPQGTNVQVGGQLTPFTYPNNTWFPISFYFDLDEDEASIKINNVMVKTWQFSLTENGGTGTRQLGALDFYPPQSGSTYYLDNFVYAAMGGPTFPIIDVTPTDITEALPVGNETATTTVKAENSGTSIGDYWSWFELDFEPLTGSNTYTLTHCNQSPNPLGGLGYSYTYNVTVEFAHKFLCEHIAPVMGTSITKLAYYLDSYPTGGNAITFRVYGPNKPDAPGELLAETTLNNPVSSSWNEVTFANPVLIDKSEYWLTVEYILLPATYPIGHDSGPIKPNLNWRRTDGGAWSPFEDTGQGFGNWMIKGTTQGAAFPCWLTTIGDTYASLPMGTSKTFDAKVSAAGLEEGVYTGNLFVFTNDTEHLLYTIPCKLTVGDIIPTFPILNVTPTSITETVVEGAAEPITTLITVANTGDADGEYEAAVAGGDQWLTLDGDTKGTVAPNASKSFNAIINAAGLEVDTYNANIIVSTNDAANPTFTVACTLVVEEKVGIDAYIILTKIFPNPASNNVTIESNQLINHIEIINFMGQTVYSSVINSEKTVLNTSDLSAGVYFIRLHTEAGIQNNKLIIK